ncbi:hypothetical protein RJ640_008381 [Escallonia rubra]|uniref:NmrA-like domain-containing protein n=1 Tax=Escallonia rubra TaxID=112253 RepID=A0AA88R1V4_9ASTE|nr:hypothetical protein RJ640_008381 [Escallonia rubra]
MLEAKARIRRAVEAEGIPYRYVLPSLFAGYFLRTLSQPGAAAPPRDKVVILGDGNPKEASGLAKHILSINQSFYIKGDHTNFEIEPTFGVEASQLYPDPVAATAGFVGSVAVESQRLMANRYAEVIQQPVMAKYSLAAVVAVAAATVVVAAAAATATVVVVVVAAAVVAAADAAVGSCKVPLSFSSAVVAAAAAAVAAAAAAAVAAAAAAAAATAEVGERKVC